MIRESDRATVGAIVEALGKADRVLVSSHAGPDGDSIGSSIGLLLALKRAGKTVRYVNADAPPGDLGFLEGFDELRRPASEIPAYNLGVVLDTAYRERLGAAWKPMASVPHLVVIDHHETPGGSNITSAAWIDPSAASVSVMVADLLDEMRIPIDRAIAYALYTGLFTDTFSFGQANTNPAAMRFGARCLEAGVDPFFVTKKILESRSLTAVKLCGLACHRAEVDRGIAHSWLTQADYRETGGGDGDADGIARALREIGAARVVAFFRELSDGKIKATFRSKDGTDVAAVARAFGGGGHVAAAGCSIQGTLDDVRPKVLAALVEALGKSAR